MIPYPFKAQLGTLHKIENESKTGIHNNTFLKKKKQKTPVFFSYEWGIQVIRRSNSKTHPPKKVKDIAYEESSDYTETISIYLR